MSLATRFRSYALSHRPKSALLLIAYTAILATFFYVEAFGLEHVRVDLARRYPGQFAAKRVTREFLTTRQGAQPQSLSASSDPELVVAPQDGR